MPYMTGMVSDVENPLFLRKINVSFWAVVYIFGKDAMYWYRMERSFGRNNLVGTTIKDPETISMVNLPRIRLYLYSIKS